MTTRAESSAATRRDLLDAASSLLDTGGPDAVTLREVGARAGVSRSAPYRHFADKESLLTAVATDAWTEVGDTLDALVSRGDLAPEDALHRALTAMVGIGRARPHLYRLMFTAPVTDPTAAVRAAGRTQDLFLTIVARVVGPQQARQYAGLLLTSAHGITGLESSGHLVWDKWHATADDLVALMITLLHHAEAARAEVDAIAAAGPPGRADREAAQQDLRTTGEQGVGAPPRSGPSSST